MSTGEKACEEKKQFLKFPRRATVISQIITVSRSICYWYIRTFIFTPPCVCDKIRLSLLVHMDDSWGVLASLLTPSLLPKAENISIFNEISSHHKPGKSFTHVARAPSRQPANLPYWGIHWSNLCDIVHSPLFKIFPTNDPCSHAANNKCKTGCSNENMYFTCRDYYFFVIIIFC